MNDYEIKVVRVQGEFTWHSQADTDELFPVINGELTIQMRDGNVTLQRARTDSDPTSEESSTMKFRWSSAETPAASLT